MSSLVTNEGLEMLRMLDQRPDHGMFSNTRLESVTVSASVKMVDDCVFSDCSKLRRLKFRTRSSL